VEEGGPLARELVVDAVERLRPGRGGTERLLGLCKLGIASHTFADSWAHEGFSGRHNAHDNDIEHVEVFEDGRWQALPFFHQLALNIAFDIGHLEADGFPDQAHCIFRYERNDEDDNLTPVEKWNPRRFAEAAGALYRLYLRITGARDRWPARDEDLVAVLSQKMRRGKEAAPWEAAFGAEVEFRYDPRAWRRAALQGERHDWDHFATQRDYDTLRYERNRGDASSDLWFAFHVAAAEQRRFARDRIRWDLL
jgi:hypothetical protein